MRLTEVEISVIITALQQDIMSDQKKAQEVPAVAGYIERNVQFRQALIAKLAANVNQPVNPPAMIPFADWHNQRA
jgi:hypothetical protein